MLQRHGCHLVVFLFLLFLFPFLILILLQPAGIGFRVFIFLQALKPLF
jgi:hypothetical protein